MIFRAASYKLDDITFFVSTKSYNISHTPNNLENQLKKVGVTIEFILVREE